MDYKLFTLALLFNTVCVHAVKVSPRIAGGAEITEDNRKTYNYIVTVKNFKAETCTGVVLHERFVLVPAHCFDKTWDVATIYQGNATYLEQAIISSKIHKHEGYNPDTAEKDIAIIELTESLTFSDNLNRIEVSNSTPPEATSCQVSGYGQTETQESTSSFKAFFLDVLIKKKDACIPAAAEGRICVGVEDDNDNSRTLCKGDVGAPLVCEHSVVAIAITDDKCGSTNSDLFLELKDFRPWIYTKVPNSALPVVLSPLVLLSTLAVIFKIRS